MTRTLDSVNVFPLARSAIDIADQCPNWLNFRIAVDVARGAVGGLDHPSISRLVDIALRDGSTNTIVAAVGRVVDSQTPWLFHLPRINTTSSDCRVKLVAGLKGAWMHAAVRTVEDEAISPQAVHAYDPVTDELVDIPLVAKCGVNEVDVIGVRLMPDERRESLALAVAGIALPKS